MPTDLSDLPDNILAEKAKEKHQPAYTALMERHRASVYRLIRHHVGDADEALDLTQECFVSAFSALDRYDSTRPFRLWIARIAINKCRDWGRRRAVRRFFTFALPLSEAQDIDDDQVDAETTTADREELASTMAAIAALPTNLREVLVLRAIEGLSQSEVALTLNCTEKTIETRLYRARAKLKDLLRGYRLTPRISLQNILMLTGTGL